MTRVAIVLSLLLTACYTEENAHQQMRDLNRPEPIRCVTLSQAGADSTSFACTDGDGISWVCGKSEGCFRWSK